MKNLITLLIIVFFANLNVFAQPFTMKFVLDDEANTIDLVIKNTGPADYSYTQVQDINAHVITGADKFIDIANTDFDLVLNSGNEYLNLGAAFNNVNTIAAGEEVVLGTINLIPASYAITDFVIDSAVFPPPNRASFGTDTSSEFPMVQATVLPIELYKFNVRKENNSALLNWATSLEINSSHFEIEKSRNNTNWEKIGKVEAAGNSTGTKEYKFLDDSFTALSSGAFYYRLRMVDLDGQYEYSDVRSIRFDRESRDTRFTIYPNPTKDFAILAFNNVEISELVELNIYDVAGRIVLHQLINPLEETKIEVATLGTGSYNAIVKIGNQETFNKKFIVVK